jgi:DUF218 domain
MARSLTTARRWWAVLGCLACCGALIASLTFIWFFHPESVLPPQVDAVVVLAGGWGERLDRGLELLARGKSRVLVLNKAIHWNGPEADPVKRICATGSPGFEVVCVAAVPDSTKGEAMVISALARQRHWSSLALVTTNHHLSRSTRWFRRCFSGQTYPVSAGGSWTHEAIFHEWMGTLAQLSIDRSCR